MHPHIHHTYFLTLSLLICLLQAWLISDGHSTYIWNMYKMAYRVCNVYLGPYVTSHKEIKTFCTLSHPLPDTHTYITPTSCSTTFDLHATGLVDLRWPSFSSHTWNMHKIIYQKVSLVYVWGCSLPVIGHTHLQSRKGTSPIVVELLICRTFVYTL